MPQTIDLKELPGLLEGVQREFEQITYKKALGRISQVIQQRTFRNFLTQSAANGLPWPPLSPVTVARKGHDTILVDTTRLRRSVVQDGADHIEDITNDSLVYGTRVEYAAFHQKDRQQSQFPAPQIPQREFLAVVDEDVDEMADIVADHIVDELKA